MNLFKLRLAHSQENGQALPRFMRAGQIRNLSRREMTLYFDAKRTKIAEKSESEEESLRNSMWNSLLQSIRARKKQYKKIIISGDVFRTVDGEPNQLWNVQNLFRELYHPLCDAAGQKPQLRYRLNTSDGGVGVIRRWYGFFDLQPSPYSWAAIYENETPPSQLVDELRWDYEDALVIGFELSPMIKAALSAMNSDWIEVFWHPIRFLEDLSLVFRPSWPIRPKALKRQAGLLFSADVEQSVRHVKDYYNRISTQPGPSDAVIFLAQVIQDRNLIKNGRFCDVDELADRVSPLIQGRRLLIKPHPREISNPIIERLKSGFGGEIIETPIYELLTRANNVEFVTISSSSGTEAQCFGHPVQFLDRSKDQFEGIASISAHRSPSFWRALLSGTPVRKADIPGENRRNRLRQAWNYHNEALAFWEE